MTIDHYSTATAMLDALSKKQVSSVELTQMHIQRINSLDGALNAIPVLTLERALDAAKQADKKLAAGEAGALLGLPMTLKESTQVAGLPQSAGLLPFKDHKPAADGKLAAAVFAAGANLLGKTNIPVALGDWQADSPVYGRTNNPFDLGRTPGGSTGGGGAALAAGLTPLEVGSDIGGSIRVPAAFCGCFGHRPSETAIPRSGAFPGAELPNYAFRMAVQGPLARSAADLSLLFDVIAGPDLFEDVAWRLSLPASRIDSLKGCRVAVMPELPGARASSAMLAKVDELTSLLKGEGAKVGVAMPSFDFDDYYLDYLRTLYCMVNLGLPQEALQAQAEALRQDGTPTGNAMADGLTMAAPDFVTMVGHRQQYAQAWQTFFEDWDLLIGPMTLDSAFPHQTGDLNHRILLVDNEEVPYTSNIIYPMLAIYCGLPSTAFPMGLDPQGLPLGMQAIGPYLEDRTTLKFAALMEAAGCAFLKPPGY